MAQCGEQSNKMKFLSGMRNLSTPFSQKILYSIPLFIHLHLISSDKLGVC